MNISALWAKKDKKESYWLPLKAHLTDTAEIARLLWRCWLSEKIKKTIAESIGASEQEAERLFVFIAISHDIGKATPVFSAKKSFYPNDLDINIYDNLLRNGFFVLERREDYREYARTPHALASQLLLENATELQISGTNLIKKVGGITGAHHGKPANGNYSRILHAYKDNFGLYEDSWMQAQRELISMALEFGGYRSLSEIPGPTMPGQVLLSGLLIVADWIASNTDFFPLVSIDVEPVIYSKHRAEQAWGRLNLPRALNPAMSRTDDRLYQERFENILSPNEMQTSVLKAAKSVYKPGIMIIEAPMGSGKTEAALIAAELFRDKTGSNGLFFALPTQATSDGMFPRLLEWTKMLGLDENQSINLVHGKAQFNKDLGALGFFGNDEASTVRNASDDIGSDDEGAVFVHQWFRGRKKALLADYVVGTIDQLLQMALKQKHVMLRHVGLAGKVVIIDELHSYDSYMSEYLKTALSWLGSYGVPVIILSATITSDTRRDMMNAYLQRKNSTDEWSNSKEYPFITYSDGDTIKCSPVQLSGWSKTVEFSWLTQCGIVDKLEELLSGGGCAGVIMDTVRRAQELTRILKERFEADSVLLIHSGFTTADRIDKENRIREVLGRDGSRPEKLIVVGTQVLEQSLDLDFDVMISDIAPVDLLIQRIGRMHRHDRADRPAKLSRPRLYITGFENDDYGRGIKYVYYKYLLDLTKEKLNEQNGVITLPGDISRLINEVYDKDAESTEDKEKWLLEIGKKVANAGVYCIAEPNTGRRADLTDWLKDDADDKNSSEDPSGKKAEAAVRDSNPSIEVLLIKNDNGFSLLSGKRIPPGELTDDIAVEIARHSIKLPYELCKSKIIDAVILTLEKETKRHFANWLESPWLRGELILVLDSECSASLHGYKLTYSAELGLEYEQEHSEEGCI